MKYYFSKVLRQTFLICFFAIQLLNSPRLYSQDSTEEIFTDIYETKYWGADSKGKGTSGIGSTQRTTEIYCPFLQIFLRGHQIRTVVDIGCGDWTFSRTMDWSGIDYTGIDIVKSVIKRDQRKYGTRAIRFIHGNGLEMDLPKADLLICKDVLQHLPNEDVQKLTAQFHKFKYCLITNDVDPITLTSDNPQIKPGEYRLLDLSQPPFSIDGIKVLDYWAEVSHKLVFLITNENNKN